MLYFPEIRVGVASRGRNDIQQ